jgi:hypothetical protein
VSTLELRGLFERLAAEYKLPVPRYFGESYNTLFEVAPEKKLPALLDLVKGFKDDSLNLVVVHVGLRTPEMDALQDSDSPLMHDAKGASLVSIHREAELKALLSKDFQRALKARSARLLTFRDLAKDPGLKAMRRPAL